MTLLAVRDLGKAWGGVEAVSGVSFSLEAGEVLALIGPNGAGKSTCFNMLNGQVIPDRGEVLLAGRDVTGHDPARIWRAGVGRTFQIAATFTSMTVRENVQMALIVHHGRLWRMIGAARRAFVDEADALLEQVGLVDAAEQPCSALAYGDLKRLELAMALAGAPRLLLMDEPTAGMSPAERHALMALTVRLARERDIGVLFTEHDVDVVFSVADRVMVLDRGRIITIGTPLAVRDDPRVRAVYLGESLPQDGGAS